MTSTYLAGDFSLVFLVYNLQPGGRFVIELWVPELRKLQPGQTATVFTSQPAARRSGSIRPGPAGTAGWRSCLGAGRPECSEARTDTSGLPSLT